MSTRLSLSDQTKDITKTRMYDNDLLLGFRLAANQATTVKAMTRLLWEAICEPVSPWETPQVPGSQEISGFIILISPKKLTEPDYQIPRHQRVHPPSYEFT